MDKKWTMYEKVLYNALIEQWDLDEEDAAAIIDNKLYEVFTSWSDYGKKIYDEFGGYVEDDEYGIYDAMMKCVDWEKFGQEVANDYVIQDKVYVFEINSDWEYEI